MLEDHPTVEAAVVVMGRAHVPGYARILVEGHGFALVWVTAHRGRLVLYRRESVGALPGVPQRRFA